MDKPLHLSRRDFTWMGTVAVVATACSPAAAAAPALSRAELQRALQALEAKAGGRLGVAVSDGRSAAFGLRVDERFGMCSTFKLPLAAAVLHSVEAGKLAPDLWVPYTRADMLSHAPVTSANLAKGGMRVLALAEATQTTSDNPAANLLLKLLGGPSGFTAWLRAIGDDTTRVDRLEPEMNRVPPGEMRDTTTPAAMAATARRLVLGDTLRAESRERLTAWMVATTTGKRRLRAGLPKDWRAGDKTGTGMHASMPDKLNDVAVVWPAGRPPFTLAAYYDGPKRGSEDINAADEAVLAEVGRLVGRWDGA